MQWRKKEYLKKELSCEVHVLHADKYEILLQVDSIIFDGFGQVLICWLTNWDSSYFLKLITEAVFHRCSSK